MMNVSRFFRIVACVTVCLGLAWVLARPAAACSCVSPPPPEAALEEADAVFAGEVLRIDRHGDDGREWRRVVLRVERSFKGDLGSTVEIRTATSSAACGFPFEDGRRYLVYAHTLEGGTSGSALRTGLCTRTASIDRAREDLTAFDAVGLLDEDEGAGCGGLTNVGALQAFIIVLVGGLWMRRRWA